MEFVAHPRVHGLHHRSANEIFPNHLARSFFVFGGKQENTTDCQALLSSILEISLQYASSRFERLQGDAWHGNAMLSCGPHKLDPQQKLSEFNGELVACLGVQPKGSEGVV